MTATNRRLSWGGLAVALGLLAFPALADNFDSAAGGPTVGAVIERRLGTSGRTGVPVDETNPLPVTGGGAPTGTAGSPNAAVTSVQGVTNGVPQPTLTTPGTRTLVPLDVATVTTGGTAVTALTAGHRSAGGWLYNPPEATIKLCINEVATASGTTTAGSLVCIPPDRTYNLTASAGAVSVITSDSAHPFGGYGYQ